MDHRVCLLETKTFRTKSSRPFKGPRVTMPDRKKKKDDKVKKAQGSPTINWAPEEPPLNFWLVIFLGALRGLYHIPASPNWRSPDFAHEY